MMDALDRARVNDLSDYDSIHHVSKRSISEDSQLAAHAVRDIVKRQAVSGELFEAF